MLALNTQASNKKSLARFLNDKADEYNRPNFIAADPISIPHRFTTLQDIEIAGFFAAIFSWGNRTTIIRKTSELLQMMDNAPHQFILQHEYKHLQQLLGFKHRTFNATDLLYFIHFFRHHYTYYNSLEDAFLPLASLQEHRHTAPGKRRSSAPPVLASPTVAGPVDLTRSLSHFYDYFFSLEDPLAHETGTPALLAPPRTYKHIATPEKNSACKRLNMFLRWMVRKDEKGVDFGCWTRISPSQLVCPLDVHVGRVARRLGMMTRNQTDWQAALQLTEYLSTLDSRDPVKYDFALFGLGVMEKFS